MLSNEIFKTFEPLWTIGDTIFKENNKIGFNIKYYCLNQLMKHKDKYNDEETDKLIRMVQEVKEIQTKMNPVDIHCQQKEYETFITNYFDNLERQRKQEVISIELGNKYKQFSYLLDPLEQFQPLNDKTRKIRKIKVLTIILIIETFCIYTSKEMIDKCNIDYTNNSNNNNGNKVKTKLNHSNDIINNDFLQEDEENNMYMNKKTSANNNPYVNYNTNNNEKEIETKNQYVNVSTPKGEETVKTKRQVDSPEIYSFIKRQSGTNSYVNERGNTQTEFVKKNNYNAIDELNSGNIAIAIQLIKNSINTLHTILKGYK